MATELATVAAESLARGGFLGKAHASGKAPHSHSHGLCVIASHLTICIATDQSFAFALISRLQLMGVSGCHSERVRQPSTEGLQPAKKRSLAMENN